MASFKATTLPTSTSTNVPPSIASSSSLPPCGFDHPSSDEEAIEELGRFDAVTYVLPSRRLGLGVFLQYHPPVGGRKAEVVRREPEQHLRVLNVSVSFQKSLKNKKFTPFSL